MTGAPDDLDALLSPEWLEIRRQWRELAADVAARGGWVGPPLACVLGDRLRRLADEGDEEAAALLQAAAPKNMPHKVKIAYRRAHLRMLAARIRAAAPWFSETGTANLIAAIGDRVVVGRSFDDIPKIKTIAEDERKNILSTFVDIFAMCGNKWPSPRQVRTIIYDQ